MQSSILTHRLPRNSGRIVIIWLIEPDLSMQVYYWLSIVWSCLFSACTKCFGEFPIEWCSYNVCQNIGSSIFKVEGWMNLELSHIQLACLRSSHCRIYLVHIACHVSFSNQCHVSTMTSQAGNRYGCANGFRTCHPCCFIPWQVNHCATYQWIPL